MTAPDSAGWHIMTWGFSGPSGSVACVADPMIREREIAVEIQRRQSGGERGRGMSTRH
jgi:hypothetical protein